MTTLLPSPTPSSNQRRACLSRARCARPIFVQKGTQLSALSPSPSPSPSPRSSLSSGPQSPLCPGARGDGTFRQRQDDPARRRLGPHQEGQGQRHRLLQWACRPAVCAAQPPALVRLTEPEPEPEPEAEPEAEAEPEPEAGTWRRRTHSSESSPWPRACVSPSASTTATARRTRRRSRRRRSHSSGSSRRARR